MREPVKGRTQAGRRREARARQTRQRIVDAALGLFLQRGYTATTVEAIASRAGVAPATIYQAFGSKQAVLASGLDVTVAGDATPVAILDRDWVKVAAAEADPGRRLAAVVGHACEIAARTAAIKEVMRDAAATEPAVGDLIEQDNRRRYLTQQALVDLLVEQRPLRAGVDRRRAVDVFFALVNSQTYQLLVEHLGWTVAEWRDWLVQALERELFGPSTITVRSADG
ncbi:MAG TPA: helix-turn-helix domain-containing protein [Actinomycetes bacterium]|jgi:AcrR family transcriptional regulator|nr:helix-turn-helix domain-containing protein [Actinomycetes bacterium]